ncbi:motility protein A [[Clostridium] aminophilum]|uniref:motility protein A n=1 Tax=[Clostridium] aminophilum TaxID=1526 RepID=UPI0004E1B786|nr:MotA/TolQ/ExbB proton channel family protein [[Clostridium] aminophilum]MCR4629029.1 MotA/TolQ/ExbB proton channel family protein [Clostridium sp.]
MDFTTLIGWILAAVLIVNGIGVDKLGNFFDMPSLLIVVGGTIAGLVACYPFRILKDIPKHIGICFRGKKYNIPKTVDQIIDLAMIARQNGLLALEEKAEEIKEPFFKSAVLLIVDANDPDKVRAVLERQVEDMMSRHEIAKGLYVKGSALAPAFGMIGTLVGLINMLKGMDLSGSGGASTLGQDMGVALITTFYGSAFSNIIFHPIAQKLGVREDEEILYDTTVIEGVLAIQAGENPKSIREHLLASLPQSVQKKLMKNAGDGGGEG